MSNVTPTSATTNLEVFASGVVTVVEGGRRGLVRPWSTGVARVHSWATRKNTPNALEVCVEFDLEIDPRAAIQVMPHGGITGIGVHAYAIRQEPSSLLAMGVVFEEPNFQAAKLGFDWVIYDPLDDVRATVERVPKGTYGRARVAPGFPSVEWIASKRFAGAIRRTSARQYFESPKELEGIAPEAALVWFDQLLGSTPRKDGECLRLTLRAPRNEFLMVESERGE